MGFFGGRPDRALQQVLDFPLQQAVGLQADRIAVIFGFQKQIQLGNGECRITAKELLHRRCSIAGDHRLQHRSPVIGTMDIAVAKQGAFQVSILIETEQRMVAGAFKVAVVRRAFLMAVRLAHRAIHIEDDPVAGLALPQPVDPLPGQVGQDFQIAWLRQHVGLKPAHLAGGGGGAFPGSPAHDLPHRRINRQSFGIIGILVTGQAAVDRLTQKPHQSVLDVLSGAPILEQRAGHCRQAQRLIQFPVDQQSRVAGHSSSRGIRASNCRQNPPEERPCCFHPLDSPDFMS